MTCQVFELERLLDRRASNEFIAYVSRTVQELARRTGSRFAKAALFSLLEDVMPPSWDVSLRPVATTIAVNARARRSTPYARPGERQAVAHLPPGSGTVTAIEVPPGIRPVARWNYSESC
jgi:hypothetical protein